MRTTMTHTPARSTRCHDKAGNVDLEPDVVSLMPTTFDTGETAVVSDVWVRLANLQLGGKRRQMLLFLNNCGDVPIDQVRLTRTAEPGGKHWRLRQDVIAKSPGQTRGPLPVSAGRTLELTLSNLIGAAEIAVGIKASAGLVRLTGVAR
jgi:hypothetical protein